MAINHPDCFPTIQPAWQQKDEEALKDEQIKKLKQKVGELVLESDVLKEAVKPYLPFDRGTSDE